jgi:hypothetical protein
VEATGSLFGAAQAAVTMVRSKIKEKPFLTVLPDLDWIGIDY